MDEIAAAQAQLGRSLEQAQQGVDQAMAGLIRDEGHSLVMLLAGLLRLTRMSLPSRYACIGWPRIPG